MIKLFSCYNLYRNNNAFCIEGKFYTYHFCGRVVSHIAEEITKKNLKTENIGLIIGNDIATYCCLLGIIHAGYGYVPLNPDNPQERNINIVNQAKIEILCISAGSELPDYFDRACFTIISIDILSIKENIELTEPVLVSDLSNAYILFTSGSSGVPKGVPISRGNLLSFLDSFNALFPFINSSDRFLQMFSLSFDASVMHIFPALIKGACIYTIDNKGFKYLEAIRVLNDYKITFALLMPSMLSYLHSYFDSIYLPDLHYSLFGGEAVPAYLINDWQKCVPYAELYNAYGPTEATVFFMVHKIDKNRILKDAFNGTIFIGKPVLNATVLVLDENYKIITDSTAGELCVASPQLTRGYTDPTLNEKSFFTGNVDEVKTIFYKTGDIVTKNELGVFCYIKRKDNQVQIDGHRIELGEIEVIARQFFEKNHETVAIPFENHAKSTRIALFIVAKSLDIPLLRKFFYDNLPPYMVPDKYIIIDQIPLTMNGKTDTNKLSLLATSK